MEKWKKGGIKGIYKKETADSIMANNIPDLACSQNKAKSNKFQSVD